MDNLDKRIDEFIESKKDEIVDNIIKLINIPSPATEATANHPYGDGSAKAIDAALELGEKFGFSTKNYGYHAASIRYDKGEEEIGFFAHMDVVPAGNNWTYEPYNAVYEDGFIIGRGSNDDKGPFISALYTLLCCKELNLPIKKSLRLVIGGNEENGMPDLKHYLDAEPKKPVFSMVADASFPVCYAEKGMITVTSKTEDVCENIVELRGGEVPNVVCDSVYVILQNVSVEDAENAVKGHDCIVEELDGNVKITASGVATHAAKPAKSVNAIAVLANAIVDKGILRTRENAAMKGIASYLEDFYGESFNIASEDEDTGRTTHVAGIIRNHGKAIAINFNIRFPVSITSKEIFAEVTKRFAEYGFTIDYDDDEYVLLEPGYVDPKLPIVKKLTSIYNEVADDDKESFYEGSYTYARLIPNAVAFGPHFPDVKIPFTDGRGKEHMPDECVSVQNLLDAIKIYVKSVVEIDKYYEQ